ncbi:MAG TPA: hypothetical protein PLD02_08950 [Saprospiraceae bacterium]|nr:hypothetical protein [Saprospiraceae bacterium]
MTIIKTRYQTRPIRFIELHEHQDWIIKIYSISIKNEFAPSTHIELAKQQLNEWLKLSKNYPLTTYRIATLIIHEGKEGCFAILNWWIDDNMLQNHVFVATHEDPDHYKLFSDKGIITCVWELAVIWYERNAWVEHVLKHSDQPNFEAYLNSQLNADV